MVARARRRDAAGRPRARNKCSSPLPSSPPCPSHRQLHRRGRHGTLTCIICTISTYRCRRRNLQLHRRGRVDECIQRLHHHPWRLRSQPRLLRSAHVPRRHPTRSTPSAPRAPLPLALRVSCAPALFSGDLRANTHQRLRTAGRRRLPRHLAKVVDLVPQQLQYGAGWQNLPEEVSVENETALVAALRPVGHLLVRERRRVCGVAANRLEHCSSPLPPTSPSSRRGLQT